MVASVLSMTEHAHQRTLQKANAFIKETLELVNELQITEEEGVTRVVKELWEEYRGKMLTILDDTRPKISK